MDRRKKAKRNQDSRDGSSSSSSSLSARLQGIVSLEELLVGPVGNGASTSNSHSSATTKVLYNVARSKRLSTTNSSSHLLSKRISKSSASSSPSSSSSSSSGRSFESSSFCPSSATTSTRVSSNQPVFIDLVEEEEENDDFLLPSSSPSLPSIPSSFVTPASKRPRRSSSNPSQYPSTPNSRISDFFSPIRSLSSSPFTPPSSSSSSSSSSTVIPITPYPPFIRSPLFSRSLSEPSLPPPSSRCLPKSVMKREGDIKDKEEEDLEPTQPDDELIDNDAWRHSSSSSSSLPLGKIGGTEGDGEGEGEGNTTRILPSYYLRNFNTVLTTVLARNRSLFSESELLLEQQFQELEESEQRLFIRLYHRSLTWFQESGLLNRYPEIPQVSQVIQSLIKKRHLQEFEWKDEDLVEFVSKVLTVAQLKSWLHFVIFSKSTPSSSSPYTSLYPSLPTRGIPIDNDLKRRCKGAKTKKELLDIVSFLFTPSSSSSSSSSSSRSSPSSSALQLRCVEVAKEMFGVFVKISDSDRKFFNMVHRIFFLSSSGGGSGNGTTTSTSSLMILVDMDRIRFPLYPIKALWDEEEEGEGEATGRGEGVDDFLLEEEEEEEEGGSQSQVESLLRLHSQQDLPLGRRKDRQWDQERWLRRKKEQQNRLEAVLESKPVFSSRESFDKYEESLELARAMLLALQGTVEEDSVVMEEEGGLSQEFQDELGGGYGEIGAGNDELALEILEEAATQMALEAAKLNRTTKSNKAEDAKEDSNTSQFLLRFTKGYICASIVEIGISLLESKKAYEQATFHLIALLDSPYRSGKRGYYWNRLALNLEHLGSMNEAIKTCEQALVDDFVRFGDRLSLERRLDRLCKPPRRWKKPTHLYQLLPKVQKPKEAWIRGTLIVSNPGESTAGKKNRWVGYDHRPCSVESLALQFYKLKEDWSGMHCEGSIFSTLFSLLFWDIIFYDVPHVFQTPFQDAPLDFGTDVFYPARRELLDKRLATIALSSRGKRAEEMIEVLLKKAWKNYGVQCRGINWQRNSLEELISISSCISGSTLFVIFSAFAKDYRRYSSGMPDLFLWNPETKESKLVEVKGPNDKLSDKQKVWIEMLSSVETNIEVCHVVNLGLSPTISKSSKGKAGAKGRVYEDEELLWLYHKGEDGEEDENEEPQFME